MGYQREELTLFQELTFSSGEGVNISLIACHATGPLGIPQFRGSEFLLYLFSTL